MDSKTNVFDVAKYILKKTGPISAMKLQKLVYYSQAWSLVWDEKPLFPERIEAWANGPVVRKLFEAHKGKFIVNERHFAGNTRKFTAEQRNTMDAVVEYYGSRDPQWLSDLTHMEAPWRKAREGVPDGVRSGAVIKHSEMHVYYSHLRAG